MRDLINGRPCSKRRARTSAVALLALAGVVLAGANLRASLASVGPVIRDIESDVGLSAAGASILISVPLLCFAFVAPFAAFLTNRFRMMPMLTVVLFALTFGITLRSLPVSFALWAGSFILGASIGILNVVLPALVKRDFPDRIGLITGIYIGVQSGVAAIASGLAAPISSGSDDGWRYAIGIWSGLALLAASFYLVLLWSKWFNSHTNAVPSARVLFPRSSILAWQVAFFMATASILFYAYVALLPTIIRDNGWTASAAGFQLFWFQVVAIVASFVAGGLIQRTRSQSGLGISAAIFNMVSVLGLLLAPGWLWVWVAIGGVGNGMGIVLALSFFGLRTRTNTDAASLSGMAQFVGYTMAAAGTLILSAVHDATGGWEIPLMLLLAVAAMQIPLGYLAGRNRFVVARSPDARRI